MLGVIPPLRGRPPTTGEYVVAGFFRATLRKLWPIVEYGQRWQIETNFSMFKGLLRVALRSRRRQAIDREIFLRAITLNLMIVLPSPRMFLTEQDAPHSLLDQGRHQSDPGRPSGHSGRPGRSPRGPRDPSVRRYSPPAYPPRQKKKKFIDPTYTLPPATAGEATTRASVLKAARDVS